MTVRQEKGGEMSRRAAVSMAFAMPFASWLRPAVASQADSAEPMRQAAVALLQAADGAQRQRLHAEFASPRRTRWHYFPGTRDGLAVVQMPAPVATRAADLLRVSLSASGLAKVQGVLELAKMPQSARGAGSHAFLVFGQPAARGAWGWRLDGHHLSLNFTVLDDRIVSTTPLFLGADPMEVMEGPNRGLAPLFRERHMGRDLARALTSSQLAQARRGRSVPSDILAGPGKAAAIDDVEGLPYRELGDDTQRHLMMGLAETYLDNLTPLLARLQMMRVAGATRDELRFIWRGGLEQDDVCYYRIQGRAMWIEYATRRQADHVHTLWREPGNDFGRAALSALGQGAAVPAEA